ncbi:LysR family transcriptional regulator [Paludibacterium yongneupense]|uniref:LysR family transcriptional regulator n=1 Tax=Paludibacterium yongneupense TaxID=400061 RepID=UPI0003F5FA09|nr:LysR family transcriptional regulator [Paludibacterium yongneupense]
MRLDFVDLRLFALLAETGSLSETALQLPMALSAASQRLKKMEELYAVRLVERHSRGVVLTPAGEVLLFHARGVLEASARLNGEMGDISRGLTREIRLLANTVASTVFLPDVLGRFLAREPDIDIRLLERPSREIVSAIEEGEADIGILDSALGVERLSLFPFARDRLVLVTPLDHELSHSLRIGFAQTLDYPFVGLSEYSAIQLFLEDMARLKGKALRHRVHTNNYQSLAGLVGSGAGLAILPSRIARRYAPLNALHVIELEDAWAIRDLKICVRDAASLPAHGRRLLDALLSAYDSGAGALTPAAY